MSCLTDRGHRLPLIFALVVLVSLAVPGLSAASLDYAAPPLTDTDTTHAFDPQHVAVTPDGARVYVLSDGNHGDNRSALFVFNGAGQRIAIWGSQPWATVPVTFTGLVNSSHVGDVAVDNDGNVLVLDAGDSGAGPTVRRFTPAGTLISTVALPTGNANGQVGALHAGTPYVQESGLVPLADGGFALADYVNGRAERFTSAGAFVRQWPQSAAPGGYFLPFDLTAAPNGDLYAPTSFHVARLVDPGTGSDGTFRTPLLVGSAGSGDQQLQNPSGLVLDGGGTSYVADGSSGSSADNKRVQVMGSNGTFRGHFDLPDAPGSIAAADDGTLYATGYQKVYVLRDSSFIPFRPGASPPPSGTVSGHVREQGGGDNPATPVPNVPVQLCNVDSGLCTLTRTAAEGDFAFANVDPGTYTLSSTPPSADRTAGPATTRFTITGSTAVTQNVTLPTVQPWPAGDSITQYASSPQGAPEVDWGRKLHVTFRAPPGCAVSATIHGTAITGTPTPDFVSSLDAVPENPGADGLIDYTADVGPLQPLHGIASVRFDESCGSTNTRNLPLPYCSDPARDHAVPGCDALQVYIDPAGTVTDTAGAPLAGATVTVLRDDGTGAFAALPDGSDLMSPANRANPSTTDAEGRFAWDVLAGRYVMRASKPGCHKPGDAAVPYVQTDPQTVPPAALGLGLVLDCTTPAGSRPAIPVVIPVLPTLKPKAPDTRITKAVVDRRRRTAGFRFKATGAATRIECALTRTPPKTRKNRHPKTPKARYTRSCRSPKTFKKLKAGRYAFAVRAVGPGGTDRTPAVKKFVV